MNSILYLPGIRNDLHHINKYIIIFFYIYGKIAESFYLVEIIIEIHVVDVLKLKILITIDVVNIEKIFIDFRNRTFFINTILGFNTNIRIFRKNTKIIKIIINFRKKEIVPPNTLKKIPIRIRN
jgi:hypothetical protein